MTEKVWRLSHRAFQSMIEIGEWSNNQFGDQQADKYLQELIAQCKALANGTAHSQSCKLLIGADATDDLRFTRVGRHFIIYAATPARIDIVDFVHQSRDLTKWEYKSGTRKKG